MNAISLLRFLPALGLLLALNLSVPAAKATPLVTFGGRSEKSTLPPLEKEDLKLMRKTVRKKLEGKKIGESASWTGEKSGNSGKVTYLGEATTPLGDCRHIEHTIQIKDESHARSLKGYSCEVEKDKWKFVSEKEMKRMEKKKDKNVS